MITRQHFLAAITTVCLSLPALTPYFLLPSGKLQVAVIAALSVINAAAAFSCCSVADSIAVASVGAAAVSRSSRTALILVFISGSLLSVLALPIVGLGEIAFSGILFCTANLLIAVSEGIAKASGNFKRHQLGLIASGLIFPLPFFIFASLTVSHYLFGLAAVRLVTVAIVFFFILDRRQLEQAWRSLERGWFPMNKLTQLSMLGFGYAFLERVVISTVSLLFSAPAGKFFLAIYQAIGILGGVRSQLVNTKFYLIKGDQAEFLRTTDKVLKPLLIATPLLVIMGATILTKGTLFFGSESAMLATCVTLIILASMTDLLAAGYGVLLTFTGKILTNMKSELLAIAAMGTVWCLGGNPLVAMTILVTVRMSQLYIKRRAVRAAYE